MTEVITVEPSHGAWIVARRSKSHPQSFLSGATAEAAARQWGAAMAQGGQSAEIQIFRRDGSLVERFYCPAAARAEPAK